MSESDNKYECKCELKVSPTGSVKMKVRQYEPRECEY